MSLSHFFIDRPIFATVLSIVIVIAGAIAYFTLPVAQYPDVVPPTVVVRASYPGANPEVIAETVATPLEQQINGVEDMLYMWSQSTSDGQMQLTITFRLGTDLDKAQVLVQNRVAVAEPILPEEVRRGGVTTTKSSPDLLLVAHLLSPDNRYDQAYISNYALLQVRDILARLDGVGDITVFGAREYSMRIWLDPEKVAARNLTASDVVQALREQNVQVAAGAIGQAPVPQGNAYQLSVNTLGRLINVEQFGDIILKTGDDGRITRVRDVARVEVGARDYASNSYLDGKSAVGIGIFQRPGSNALATAESVRQTMADLSTQFPAGLEYRIVYDPTVFVQESMHAVFDTLIEAFILVFIVVLIFLQDWRATLLPMIDVPVSLIGTLGVMAALGFSLNNLSLFGLVLAIGIVVDDAIVVVENIERWMARGLEPREATLKAMAEITGPVIAITLVLSSVFIPTAFLTGISGQFYRQFALTIAASTIISAINALTMAPARAVQLIRPPSQHDTHEREALPRLGIALIAGFLAYRFLTPALASLLGLSGVEPGAHAAVGPTSSALALWTLRGASFLVGGVAGWCMSPLINRLLAGFFRGFNWFFARVINVYGRAVGTVLRLSVVILVIYGGLIGLTYLGFTTVPTGFIPAQDKGYLIVDVQLPYGASLERTDAVVRQASDLIVDVPGVANAVGIAGFSGATRANSSNAGAIFTILKPFEERQEHGPNATQIIQNLRQKLSGIQEARVAVFPPPPVQGLGTAGGFKLEVQDRTGAGLMALQAATEALVAAGNQQPGLVALFTPFNANTPQLYADVDRTRAKQLNVPLNNLFDTLQVYLGSSYVNDFNLFGRTYRVTAQAEGTFRTDPDEIAKFKTRSATGAMVPLGSLVDIRRTTGSDRVVRYNMFPAAEINGDTAPGFGSGQAIATMEQLALTVLPSGMRFEWTDLAYQQNLAGNVALFIFPLCVLFVFLVLAAQYESWVLPLAIILIVPMCLLSAIAGVWLRGMDNNILTQIGFVVLVALACKNAILIVEFAKDEQAAGKDRVAAAIEACRIRLRPILMTSFAFILGVLPLFVAKGAGAEMLRALGTSVLSGMLGVTFFGLFLTPVFYVVIRWFVERKRKKPEPTLAAHRVGTMAIIALVPCLLGLLSGCMVGPDYKRPQMPVPAAFANQTQEGMATDGVETLWWRGFQDHTLEQLVDQALANNHDLRVATARLREARALRSETTFDRYPTVTSQASYTRQRASEALSATNDRDLELYDIGFDASWELDFFGRVRRSIEASSAAVGAAEASRQDVIVILLAEVARNYFELRGAQNRLAVARRNADNQQQTLDLTTALLEGGRGTELDTSRAEAQLTSTLASIPPLETAIKQAMYRLGVLTGQQPTALEPELSEPLPLPTLPTLVALGRPDDLLRRRPDIRVTERNLAAATAEVGVVTADLFPRITLTGSVAVQATDFVGLFKGGSDTFAIGPGIFWAAFDLGRVRARIRAADARTEAALAQYEQRVLLALEETETTLVDFTRQQTRRALLQASAQASEKAQNLARQRYQFGVADFLTVLDAERTLLDAQDRLADSETLTSTALVAVYKALGGGWEIAPEGAYAQAP